MVSSLLIEGNSLKSFILINITFSNDQKSIPYAINKVIPPFSYSWDRTGEKSLLPEGMKRSMMHSQDEIYYSVGSAPYGESYGQWTVRWWQWLFSIPKFTNPLLDTLGIYSNVNQPSRDVWFLVGKMPDGTTEMPYRSSKVPCGRSILFPVINCEANPLEYPELKTDQDIIDRVKTDEDTIVLVECRIDGKKIPAQRVESDPKIFKLEINKDNAFDIKEGMVKASADGFWVFLQPLEEGEHEISFNGSCEFGKLNSGARYHLQILGKE